MKLKQAYDLNPQKATRQELNIAITELKRSYKVSAGAFERRGIETELLKTVKAREEAFPELFGKGIWKLSDKDAKTVFETYRNYFRRPTYDDNHRKTGYTKNITSTYTGWKTYQEKISDQVLDWSGYKKVSEERKKEIWDIIDKVRDMDKSLFMSDKISPDILYQSGTNIKKVIAFIKNGFDDPVEIFSRLKEQVEVG